MAEVILPAIDVQKVHKAYNKKTPVLQGTDLMVRRGHIYGLLGPSGCGKTTLLKLVIGRLNPDAGKICVLGYRPGTVESQVPGSRVGYMPQELSLYMEFTVAETLKFFGRVHSMTSKQIMDRQTFLLSFLDLPSADRKVSQLSGGQQRRVSLAVALLHSPEILILDEPTVGVDPLLRQRIWDHLVGISSTNNTTIIITTHYIEEARSANAVGLMRNGRILAEGPPDKLLEKFNQTSLEDVFLHLCIKDDKFSGSMARGKLSDEEIDEGKVNETSSAVANPPDVLCIDTSNDDRDDVRLLGDDRPQGRDSSTAAHRNRTVSTVTYDDKVEFNSCAHSLSACGSYIPKGRNIWALLIKNLTQLRNQIGFLFFQFATPAIQITLYFWCIGARNVAALLIKNIHQMRRKIGFLLFQFLLPAIQITLFAFCIGGVPKNLPITIVNQDTGVEIPVFNMNLSFSKAFLDSLDSEVMTKRYTSSYRDAYQSVHNGSSWAVLEFHKNFSADSLERFLNPQSKEDVINGSMIQITMDETNNQIVMTLKAKIILAYQNITDGLAKQAQDRYNRSLPSNLGKGATEIPIDYNAPVYGLDSATFLDFVAPGIMCSIIYFLAVGLTTLSLVIERKEGLFERSLVSGVSVGEIMLGHIGTQFIVMCIQTAVLIVFTLVIFDVYSIGSVLVIIMFELIIGFTGMCLGFLISTAAQDEQSATQLSLATVFPFLLVSGILWPLQAMPQWLQYISICLPLTLAVEGLRSVLGRGWDFLDYVVWRGYLVAAGWAAGFLILSLIVAKIKKLN